MNDISPESAAEQPPDNGDRQPNGQFAEGNKLGFQPGESGNPTGAAKGVIMFGTRSRLIDAELCSALGPKSPYAKAATRLGFKPDEITVGDLLVHATKVHALAGKAPYLVEDNNRREGRQPDLVAESLTTVRIQLEVDPGPEPKEASDAASESDRGVGD